MLSTSTTSTSPNYDVLMSLFAGADKYFNIEKIVNDILATDKIAESSPKNQKIAIILTELSLATAYTMILLSEVNFAATYGLYVDQFPAKMNKFIDQVAKFTIKLEDLKTNNYDLLTIFANNSALVVTEASKICESMINYSYIDNIISLLKNTASANTTTLTEVQAVFNVFSKMLSSALILCGNPVINQEFAPVEYYQNRIGFFNALEPIQTIFNMELLNFQIECNEVAKIQVMILDALDQFEILLHNLIPAISTHPDITLVSIYNFIEQAFIPTIKNKSIYTYINLKLFKFKLQYAQQHHDGIKTYLNTLYENNRKAQSNLINLFNQSFPDNSDLKIVNILLQDNPENFFNINYIQKSLGPVDFYASLSATSEFLIKLLNEASSGGLLEFYQQALGALTHRFQKPDNFNIKNFSADDYSLTQYTKLGIKDLQPEILMKESIGNLLNLTEVQRYLKAVVQLSDKEKFEKLRQQFCNMLRIEGVLCVVFDNINNKTIFNLNEILTKQSEIFSIIKPVSDYLNITTIAVQIGSSQLHSLDKQILISALVEVLTYLKDILHRDVLHVKNNSNVQPLTLTLPNNAKSKQILKQYLIDNLVDQSIAEAKLGEDKGRAFAHDLLAKITNVTQKLTNLYSKELLIPEAAQDIHQLLGENFIYHHFFFNDNNKTNAAMVLLKKNQDQKIKQDALDLELEFFKTISYKAYKLLNYINIKTKNVLIVIFKKYNYKYAGFDDSLLETINHSPITPNEFEHLEMQYHKYLKTCSKLEKYKPVDAENLTIAADAYIEALHIVKLANDEIANLTSNEMHNHLSLKIFKTKLDPTGASVKTKIDHYFDQLKPVSKDKYILRLHEFLHYASIYFHIEFIASNFAIDRSKETYEKFYNILAMQALFMQKLINDISDNYIIEQYDGAFEPKALKQLTEYQGISIDLHKFADVNYNLKTYFKSQHVFATEAHKVLEKLILEFMNINVLESTFNNIMNNGRDVASINSHLKLFFYAFSSVTNSLNIAINYMNSEQEFSIAKILAIRQPILNILTVIENYFDTNYIERKLHHIAAAPRNSQLELKKSLATDLIACLLFLQEISHGLSARHYIQLNPLYFRNMGGDLSIKHNFDIEPNDDEVTINRKNIYKEYLLVNLLNHMMISAKDLSLDERILKGGKIYANAKKVGIALAHFLYLQTQDNANKEIFANLPAPFRILFKTDFVKNFLRYEHVKKMLANSCKIADDDDRKAKFALIYPLFNNAALKIRNVIVELTEGKIETQILRAEDFNKSGIINYIVDKNIKAKDSEFHQDDFINSQALTKFREDHASVNNDIEKLSLLTKTYAEILFVLRILANPLNEGSRNKIPNLPETLFIDFWENYIKKINWLERIESMVKIANKIARKPIKSIKPAAPLIKAVATQEESTSKIQYEQLFEETSKKILQLIANLNATKTLNKAATVALYLYKLDPIDATAKSLQAELTAEAKSVNVDYAERIEKLKTISSKCVAQEKDLTAVNETIRIYIQRYQAASASTPASSSNDWKKKDKGLTKTQQRKAEKDAEAAARALREKNKPTLAIMPSPQRLPIATASSSSTADAKKSSPANKTYFDFRLKLLSEACKHLMFIRKLAPTEDLHPDVKKHALLFNIFRCFQLLKMYQSNNSAGREIINPDSVADLRNMIRHRGAEIASVEAVMECANKLQTTMPDTLINFRISYNNLTPILDTPTRNAIMQEFLIEVSPNRWDSLDQSKLVVEELRLYKELRAFHEVEVLEKLAALDEIEIITKTYLPMIIEILTPISKSYPLAVRTNMNQNFLDECLFNLQALRMLAQMCGDICGDIANAPAPLKKFLYFCSSNEVKGRVGHEVVDTTHLAKFINGLEKAVATVNSKPVHAQSIHIVFRKPPTEAKQPLSYVNDNLKHATLR